MRISRHIYIIAFFLSSCIQNTNLVIQNVDLKHVIRKDILVEKYHFLNYKKLNSIDDTLQFLEYISSTYNENSMVFSFKNVSTQYKFHFNVCECFLHNDSLTIDLKHIKGSEGYNTTKKFLKEIIINIFDKKFKINYLAIDTVILPGRNYDKSIDTLNIDINLFELSDINFQVGKNITGKISLTSLLDSVFGTFKCNITETSKIQPYYNKGLIPEDEIYYLVNDVYMKYCNDTAKVKNIYENAFIGKLGYGMRRIFCDYLILHENYSKYEIDFIMNHFENDSSNNYFKNNDSLFWLWSGKLKNARIIRKEEYLPIVKVNLFDRIKIFKEKFGDRITFISKPLISKNGEIFIINEHFDNCDWSGTGHETTYLFKKCNNSWEIRYVLEY